MKHIKKIFKLQTACISRNQSPFLTWRLGVNVIAIDLVRLMILLSQYRSFDDSYNRRFDPLSCSLKKKLRASMEMSNLKRQYSPWYHPMICIGKKFASGKCLSLGWLQVLSYFGEEGNSGESVCTRTRLELHATRSPTHDFHYSNQRCWHTNKASGSFSIELRY